MPVPPRGSAAVEAYPARQRIEVALSARHARQPTSPWLVANGIHLASCCRVPNGGVASPSRSRRWIRHAGRCPVRGKSRIGGAFVVLVTMDGPA